MSWSRCRRRSRHRRRAARPLSLLVVVVASRSTLTSHRWMRCLTTTSSNNRGHRLYASSWIRRERACSLRTTYWPSKNLYEDYTCSPWTSDADVVRLWPLPPPLFHSTHDNGTTVPWTRGATVVTKTNERSSKNITTIIILFLSSRAAVFVVLFA